MKSIILSFLMLSLVGHSQNINFDEFTSLKYKSIGVVKNFLSKKGYYLFSHLPPTAKNSGILVFALKSEKSNSDYRLDETFIEYRFDINAIVSKLQITTKYAEIFSSVLKRCKDSNYKLIKSKSEDLIFLRVYTDGQNKITIEKRKNRRTGKNNFVIIIENFTVLKNNKNK